MLMIRKKNAPLLLQRERERERHLIINSSGQISKECNPQFSQHTIAIVNLFFFYCFVIFPWIAKAIILAAFSDFTFAVSPHFPAYNIL